MRKARPRGQAAAIQRTLGQNVHELREAAGMSQEELAARSDVSRGYISRIEKGRVNVTLSTLVRLARVLGVSAVDLITVQSC